MILSKQTIKVLFGMMLEGVGFGILDRRTDLSSEEFVLIVKSTFSFYAASGPILAFPFALIALLALPVGLVLRRRR